MAETHLTKAILKTLAGEHIEVEGYVDPTQRALEFNAGEPVTMDLELMLKSGGDLKALYISKIQKMAHIDAARRDPPIVLFCWDSPQRVFRGVITNVSATFNMFTAGGIAIGATVSISFRRA